MTYSESSCPYGGEAMTDHVEALESGKRAIHAAECALVDTAMAMDADARKAFCAILSEQGLGGVISSIRAAEQREAHAHHLDSLLLRQRYEMQRPADPQLLGPFNLGAGGMLGPMSPQRYVYEGGLASSLLSRLGL